MWVRGVAILIPGSYINEFVLVKELTNGWDPEFVWSFWLYLVVMVVSFVGGYMFQISNYFEGGAI